MADFPTLTPLSYQLLILITVIISKGIISLFSQQEPLRFFQFYCQQLSNKVNKSKNSSQQQTIAGLVAIVVSLAPIVVILWLFESFIEVDFLWQFFLLYLAMGAFGLSKVNKTLAQAIVAKQSYFAKKTLAPWVLRTTEPLSSLGLSKSAIEMKLLRTLQQGFAVTVIFFIAGPIAALAYRLLLEMHYSWNIKLERFQYFGIYSGFLVKILNWLPVRLFSLLLLFTCLGKNFMLFWRLSKKHFFKLDNNIALLLLALSLEIRLGGVAMYNNADNANTKLRKISFNDLARQPQVTDIIHANTKIDYLMALSLVLTMLLAGALEFIAFNS